MVYPRKYWSLNLNGETFSHLPPFLTQVPDDLNQVLRLFALFQMSSNKQNKQFVSSLLCVSEHFQCAIREWSG